MTPALAVAGEAFRPLARTSFTADAVRTIKDMIVDGRLEPGDRLPSERALSEALGVSRPTVREAIRSLQAMNILESRHGEGTFVSSLEPDLLAEPIDFVLQVDDGGIAALFEARTVLEAGIASLAAERATDLELAELEDFTRSGRGKIDDVDAFIEHDVEFHDRLRRAARSPVLASMLGSISTLSLETRRRTAQSRAVRARSQADHDRMVKTLKERDPEAARRAMISHLEHVRGVLT